MIKAVVFDFGGVLSRFGAIGDSTRRFAAVLECDPAVIGPQVGPLIGDWMTGRLETAAFWRQAAEAVGSAPERDYDARWTASEPRTFEPAYYELARQLRAEGYVVGALSNIGPASARIIRLAGGYRGFSPVVLSCEIGFIKPDLRAYRSLLGQLGLDGPQVVLVDDIAANLVAAAQMDIHGIHATDPAQTIAELRHLLATGQPATRR